MRPIPAMMTNEEINSLEDRGMLPPKSDERLHVIEEHPIAKQLYRQFKAGSGLMTKTQAYDIGSELDAQAARIKMLESQLALALAEGAKLFREVKAGIESIGRPPQ